MNLARGALLLAGVATGRAAPPAASPHAGVAPGGAAVLQEGDAASEAAALLERGRAKEAAARVEAALRFTLPDARLHAVYGEALAKLRRHDEAAVHYERALEQLAPDSRAARDIERALAKLDPLAKKRAAFFEKVVRTLADSAGKLERAGSGERALELAERLTPLARGARRVELQALAARVRAATTELDLDRASATGRPAGGWPLLELEGEHYELEVHLERDVAELVAATMDDIHAYYVRTYFDGDARAAGSRKAKIRIYPDNETMQAAWGGEGTPAGWWSPSEWTVHTYDTRTDTGGLDWMLEVLFHEASHHFMTLIAKGGDTPSWLNEGTASFFEGARAMADRRVLWPDVAPRRLGSLAAMLTGSVPPDVEAAPTLAQVIGYDGAASYTPEYYPWGWGLVYFLQQYEDPDTLAFVLRPLYATYREHITTRGGDPMELFEEVFLDGSGPLGHADLESFERDWRAWILEDVAPRYDGPRRRELRRARVERYLAAADAAESVRKPPVDAEELLLRALGDVERIREQVDDPDRPDDELTLVQAELLERLGRTRSAAPLYELLLDRADAGLFELDEERYASLERRLEAIDRRDAALRAVRGRSRALVGEARGLLEGYERGRRPLLVRAYGFARLAGAVLEDQEVLLPAARKLREEAREKGLLRGATVPLAGPRASWVTIYNSSEVAFESGVVADGESAGTGRVVIENMRPAGRLCTAVPLEGEYELRARLVREGPLARSTFHGVVVSGTQGGDWMMVGLDGQGRLGLKRALLAADGSVVDTGLEFRRLTPPPQKDEPLELVVRVRANGTLEVTLGERERETFHLPLSLPAVGHVGVYVKDGRCVLEDALIEVIP